MDLYIALHENTCASTLRTAMSLKIVWSCLC